MRAVESFLQRSPAALVAPAGCGKTELLAAATATSPGRVLILTHTNAGVAALRRRLAKFRVPPSKYVLATLGGWSLQLAGSFPSTTGVSFHRPNTSQWAGVYAGAADLLDLPALKRVIGVSYRSVLVDEYQDCSLDQHSLVLRLAELLPTRIVGDPLQGIFDFSADIVNWGTHVEPVFNFVPPLSVPHRWIDRNPALGSWLLEVRRRLEAGEGVDISAAPPGAVAFAGQPESAPERARLHNSLFLDPAPDSPESVVIIRQWEGQCLEITRQSRGLFRTLETAECEPLFDFARSVDHALDGSERAQVVFDFACKAVTGLASQLSTLVSRTLQGEPVRSRKYFTQLHALLAVASTPGPDVIADCLVCLRNTPKTALLRQELLREARRALAEMRRARGASLEEAAIRVRDRTRKIGQPIGRRVVGRTLLVKGLEFDRCRVLDADKMDAKNLYVALTRGSRELTVVGPSPFLEPRLNGRGNPTVVGEAVFKEDA